MGTRLGDSNIAYGCTDETWGYVQNVKHDKGPAQAEAMQGDGEVVAVEFYDERQVVTGEYIYKSVTGDPWDVVGTDTTLTLTDVGVAIYITSVSASRTTGDWKKVSFEGTYYPSLGS